MSFLWKTLHGTDIQAQSTLNNPQTADKQLICKKYALCEHFRAVILNTRSVKISFNAIDNVSVKKFKMSLELFGFFFFYLLLVFFIFFFGLIL